VTHPAGLSVFVGQSQNFSGTLDREFELVEDFGNVGRMIGNREFFDNNSGDHRASPNPRVESVGHWAAVQNVNQDLFLRFQEPGRATGSLSFQNSFHSVLPPMVQPERNIRTMDFEQLGNFRSRSPFHVEDHGMQSPSHSIGPFLGSLFIQFRNSSDCLFISIDSFGPHGIPL
jgi:hypothetical protein